MQLNCVAAPLFAVVLPNCACIARKVASIARKRGIDTKPRRLNTSAKYESLHVDIRPRSRRYRRNGRAACDLGLVCQSEILLTVPSQREINLIYYYLSLHRVVGCERHIRVNYSEAVGDERRFANIKTAHRKNNFQITSKLKLHATGRISRCGFEGWMRQHI